MEVSDPRLLAAQGKFVRLQHQLQLYAFERLIKSVNGPYNSLIFSSDSNIFFPRSGRSWTRLALDRTFVPPARGHLCWHHILRRRLHKVVSLRARLPEASLAAMSLMLIPHNGYTSERRKARRRERADM